MTPPTKLSWIIAVLIGVLGILIHTGIISISGLPVSAFWMEGIAFILLAVATLLPGL